MNINGEQKSVESNKSKKRKKVDVKLNEYSYIFTIYLIKEN